MICTYSHCSHLTRGTQRLLSVRRSKYCLEFSIAWGRLKISVTVPFVYNFRGLSNKFTTIFWSLLFQILLPWLGYFSQSKGNQKFSDSKRWRREESEKLSLSYYIKLHLKFSGKKYWSPCNFEKTNWVPLGWPNRYKFYSAT